MGNILTQKRNGGGALATALDELTYNYHTTTDGLVSNRLYQVNDVVSAGNYTDDIDDQGTFNNTHSTIETANNYGYDELGNLVRDAQEEIASIEWTVYGKMKKITRTGASSKADLEFGYDASGNRLWKKVTPKGSGALVLTYYYLRDAQGNEMCRYVKYTNTSSQLMYVAQEHSIYGSSRVGVDNRKDTLYMSAAYTPTWGGVGTSRRELGLKSFELANHLGNVLVTVSDKPVYKVSSTTIFFQPEITSSSDYYPFGAPIQGRGYSSEAYRFGFNGKEKDDEGNGEGNSYDFGNRLHDALLGRFLSVDRLIHQTPQFSSYFYAGNSPIRAIDLNGDKMYILTYVGSYEPSAGRMIIGAGAGNDMFQAAALTRQRDIQNLPDFDPTKDVVVVLQVSNLADVKTKVEESVKTLSPIYGQTVEFGMWSHAGTDGPTGSINCTTDPVDDKQMGMKGWGDINFNWDVDDSKCIAGFYGCNTGRDPEGEKASFSTEISALSNFKNVSVLGQLKSAYPSIYSNFRDNQNRESGDFLSFSVDYHVSKLDNGIGSFSWVKSISARGNTYMVGGNSAGGISGRLELSTPASQSEASPMRISKNGVGQIGGYQQGARK